jgi:hypothetical protein
MFYARTEIIYLHYLARIPTLPSINSALLELNCMFLITVHYEPKNVAEMNKTTGTSDILYDCTCVLKGRFCAYNMPVI